ncbi:MAG TPA: aldehyde dehydrogenase family protein [Gaiellales bacterium]|nr:aldehyde dehydrogenase family protein [Gaiellales bacterium]
MAQVLTQRGAFVGGEWLSGEGEEIEVRSPATGELLGAVRAATADQVDQAVAAAAEAFETWRRTSVLERVEICRRGYEICMERAEEIARMITRETGKTIRESREEMVEYTADHFRRASEDVLRHTGRVLPSTQGRTYKRILVVQEPVGVVAAISPWNFPVDIAGIPIVYGLAFGCTTVWKPSELAPLCAELFVDVLHEAGFPPGTVNLLHGRGDVGAALTAHRDVASVVFTGSVSTGEKVAREAGLKNRILELGGNGPQIVLADANLEAAADAAVMGCFYLAGQVCTAAERVLVHSEVHDRFVELLIDRTRLLQIGDPLDENTDMGPMCNSVTLERTQRHIQDAVDRGAAVVYGGGSNGMYHEPTILTGITSEMEIAREETFGPVAPIIRFSSLEEAIAIGNETEFGLTAAVFTNSLSDAWKAASELRHGTVHINETTNYWDQMAPFGGAKSSGSGRELADGIADAVTETKQITFDF